MRIPIVINLAANPEQILEMNLDFYLLAKQKIDTTTGASVWVAPNKDTWEKFKILAPKVNYVSMRTANMIPLSARKENVVYRENSPLITTTILMTPGTPQMEYSHFGDDFLLNNMVKESLIELGIPAESITEVSNDILLNGKKICGIALTKRNGYIYERLSLIAEYDDALFKLLLPEQDYLRIRSGANGKGLTGIVNEYPNFDLNAFYSTLIEKRLRAPEWSDNMSVSENTPFVTTSLDVSVAQEDIDLAIEQIDGSLTTARNTIKRVRLNPFLDLITQKYKGIQRYRDQKELGMETTLSVVEYNEGLLEVEYMRKYYDTKLEEMEASQSLLDLELMMVSYSDFSKYFDYQKSKI